MNLVDKYLETESELVKIGGTFDVPKFYVGQKVKVRDWDLIGEISKITDKNGSIRKYGTEDYFNDAATIWANNRQYTFPLTKLIPPGKIVREQDVTEEQLDELKCWPGYHRVKGTKAGFPGSCAKNEGVAESANNIEVGDEITWWYNKFHQIGRAHV